MATPSTFTAWENPLAKSLTKLANALLIPSQPGWANIPVAGICEDTRRLRAGELFVAIPGHDQDGSQYVENAANRGACAVLAERPVKADIPVLIYPQSRIALALLSAAFNDHPTRELFTVGVTGTNGKTTVCHWIAEILGNTCSRTVSTVTNQATNVRGLTTPPSPMIQSMARQAVAAGIRHLVLEASSAGIEQERLHGIDFDVCVFTNLSLEHTRHHRGPSAYQRAKIKLFESLKPEAWAIVNADDPMAERLLAATPAQILQYGCRDHGDVQASAIGLARRQSQFTVHAPGYPPMAVSLPIAGRHNISNALAAVGVGLVAGIALCDIVTRLEHADPIPGRSAFFSREDGLMAVVDFAHNGASLEALLSTLRPHFGRLIVVFGCPGDGETEKRADMGRAGAQWADRLILTSDNPKFETARAIADEIETGIPQSSLIPVDFVSDRAQAIGTAIDQAHAGDLIVLAGKGHEDEQLIGGKRYPYSDAQVLRQRGFAPEDAD